MSEVGLYVSKPGQSVNPTTDAGILFSSDYPALKIVKEGKVVTAADVTIPHGLGYAPAFFAVFDGIPFEGSVDNNNFYFSIGERLGGTLCYYIFDTKLDESKDYVSKANFLDSSSRSDSYGISITKEGYDVGDPDMRHYVLDSSLVNMILHKKVLGVQEGEMSIELIIEHGLGYPPFFLCYGYTAGTWGAATPLGNSNNFTSGSSLVSGSVDFTYSKASMLIFKNRID